MARGIVPIAVGTAGHVDHGKSSLVRALTGVDPDRLREEQERGLTIDLGFAPFEGPDGRRLSFVDVPGHERFLRNAVAGVSGVDIVLLVVSAEDGVMPQTVEHFDVVEGFGVPHVIGVLTKVDLVDEVTAELAADELSELLVGSRYEGAPVVRVSTVRGDGLDELRELLWTTACEAEPRSKDGPFRMPIQRVFSLDGIGTVTTGIPESGVVTIGDELSLLPGTGTVRVRGLHAFGGKVDRARAGHSTALSVPDARALSPKRGQVLATPGAFHSGERIDVRLRLARRARVLRHRDRIRLHLGTAELRGLVLLLDRDEASAGDEVVAELVFEEAFPAVPGELGLLRRETPPEVVGGVEVLAVGHPKQRRRRDDAYERLAALVSAGDDPTARTRAELSNADDRGLPIDELAERAGLGRDALLEVVAGSPELHLHLRGRRVCLLERVEAAQQRLLEVLQRTLKPRGAASMTLADLRSKSGLPAELFDAAVDSMIEQGTLRHQGSGKVLWPEALQPLPSGRAEVLESIVRHCESSAARPPTPGELLAEDSPLRPALVGAKLSEKDLEALLSRGCDEGRLVPCGEFLFGAGAFLSAQRELRDQALANDGEVDLPRLRDALGTSRKWLIPFLEANDSAGLTRLRAGKRRYLETSLAAQNLDEQLGKS